MPHELSRENLKKNFVSPRGYVISSMYQTKHRISNNTRLDLCNTTLRKQTGFHKTCYALLSWRAYDLETLPTQQNFTLITIRW